MERDALTGIRARRDLLDEVTRWKSGKRSWKLLCSELISAPVMTSANNLRMERFKYGWKWIKGNEEPRSALVRKKCDQFCMRGFSSNLQRALATASERETDHGRSHFARPLLKSSSSGPGSSFGLINCNLLHLIQEHESLCRPIQAKPIRNEWVVIYHYTQVPGTGIMSVLFLSDLFQGSNKSAATPLNIFLMWYQSHMPECHIAAEHYPQ